MSLLYIVIDDVHFAGNLEVTLVALSDFAIYSRSQDCITLSGTIAQYEKRENKRPACKIGKFPPRQTDESLLGGDAR